MANGILIVDDAAFMRMMIKDVLTKKKIHSRGHKVRLENGVIGRLTHIL